MNENKKPFLTRREIQDMDIVDYLASLGHQPQKIRGNDYWYLSPFRNEKTPSFKVDRKGNQWFDQGPRIGGGIIQLGMQIFGCSDEDFVKMIRADISLQPLMKQDVVHQPDDPGKHIKVTAVKSLSAGSLLHYLNERRIHIDIADAYCKQVHYELYNRQYYGIGFPNDLGGWEIRNSFAKAAATPKGITTMLHNSKDIHVFEGYFDFLTFATLHKTQPVMQDDYLVLNGIGFFEGCLHLLRSYRTAHLYLDLDNAGKKATAQALALNSNGEMQMPVFIDQSPLYTGYKDLNEWACSFGTQQQRSKGKHL